MAVYDRKVILHRMLGIYCEARHGSPNGLCADCRSLESYALARNERCPREGRQPCSVCTVHCYAPDRRERIREVMRFSAPRFMLRHPVHGFLYLLEKLTAENRAEAPVRKR